MGILICEKHGMVCPVEMCRHVAKDLDSGKYGRVYEVFWFLVCEECLHNCHLERFENTLFPAGRDLFDLPFEEIEAFFDSSEQIQDRTCRCSECVAAVKVEQARRNGQKDPFPTYDRTLNSHNVEMIEGFYNALITHFEFKDSVVFENQLAVFVRRGAYTCPLTVEIYHVVSESEQNEIVAFIENYFRAQELNQVRVRFLEAEIWETCGKGGKKRGTERLLKELFLNC